MSLLKLTEEMAGMSFINSWELLESQRKKYNEHNDCVVVAFTIALDTTYDKAHKHVANTLNRKPRRGTFDVHKKFHTTLKKTKHRVGPYSKANKITIKKFCERHPKGRYFVTVSRHALAIIDGVVYDHSDRPRRFIDYAVRIYLENNL